MSGHRHEADYIDRTIETVRNHQDEKHNSWPQWANIFADEIEDLRVEVAEERERAVKAETELIHLRRLQPYDR